MFFFFQAEDGIRDVAVTGVQTCALPIYPAGLLGPGRRADAAGDRELVRVFPLRPLDAARLRPDRLVRRADPSPVAHHGNARLEPARGVAAALRARAHVARLRGSALMATLVVH